MVVPTRPPHFAGNLSTEPLGWVGLDPTNGIVGNRDLIRVGVARDPKQAVPLWGSYDGSASDFESMSVQVNVTTDEQNTKLHS